MIQGQPRCGKPRRGFPIYDQASVSWVQINRRWVLIAPPSIGRICFRSEYVPFLGPLQERIETLAQRYQLHRHKACVRHRDDRCLPIRPVCGDPPPIVVSNQDLDEKCMGLLSLLPYNGEGTPP